MIKWFYYYVSTYSNLLLLSNNRDDDDIVNAKGTSFLLSSIHPFFVVAAALLLPNNNKSIIYYLHILQNWFFFVGSREIGWIMFVLRIIYIPYIEENIIKILILLQAIDFFFIININCIDGCLSSSIYFVLSWNTINHFHFFFCTMWHLKFLDWS